MRFPIFGSDDTAPSAAATVYNTLAATNASSWAAENSRKSPLSEDCTLTDFSLRLATAPGVGKTRVFTIRKNGADTGATFTISDANLTGSWTGTVSFTAGDIIAVQQTPTGTPTASAGVSWVTYFETTGSKSMLTGGGSSVLTDGTFYRGLGGTGSSGWDVSTATDYEFVVPTSGTFTKLVFGTGDASSPGSGNSYDVSIRHNDSTDNITASLSGTNTSVTATGTLAVVAGDRIVLKAVGISAPNNIQPMFCLTFEPTDPEETIFGFGSTAALSTSGTEYEYIGGIGMGVWNATESTRVARFPAALTFKKLYVKLTTAPGGITTRTLVFRDNGADGALTVTITGANTTGNDTTNTVVVGSAVAAETTAMKSALTGTPAATAVKFGYVIHTVQPVNNRRSLTLLGVS